MKAFKPYQTGLVKSHWLQRNPNNKPYRPRFTVENPDSKGNYWKRICYKIYFLDGSEYSDSMYIESELTNERVDSKLKLLFRGQDSPVESVSWFEVDSELNPI